MTGQVGKLSDVHAAKLTKPACNLYTNSTDGLQHSTEKYSHVAKVFHLRLNGRDIESRAARRATFFSNLLTPTCVADHSGRVVELLL